jgi:hypothetical protein
VAVHLPGVCEALGLASSITKGKKVHLSGRIPHYCIDIHRHTLVDTHGSAICGHTKCWLMLQNLYGICPSHFTRTQSDLCLSIHGNVPQRSQLLHRGITRVPLFFFSLIPSEFIEFFMCQILSLTS